MNIRYATHNGKLIIRTPYFYLSLLIFFGIFLYLMIASDYEKYQATVTKGKDLTITIIDLIEPKENKSGGRYSISTDYGSQSAYLKYTYAPGDTVHVVALYEGISHCFRKPDYAEYLLSFKYENLSDTQKKMYRCSNASFIAGTTDMSFTEWYISSRGISALAGFGHILFIIATILPYIIIYIRALKDSIKAIHEQKETNTISDEFHSNPPSTVILFYSKNKQRLKLEYLLSLALPFTGFLINSFIGLACLIILSPIWFLLIRAARKHLDEADNDIYMTDKHLVADAFLHPRISLKTIKSFEIRNRRTFIGKKRPLLIAHLHDRSNNQKPMKRSGSHKRLDKNSIVIDSLAYYIGSPQNIVNELSDQLCKNREASSQIL